MLYGGAVLFTIEQMARVAKQDAWLAAVTALVVAYVILLLALAAGPRDVNVSMQQWIEQLLGVFFGRIVNIMYFLFFLIKGAVILRSMVEVIGLAILPLTPRTIIVALFAFPAGIAARLGIEVITRTAQVYVILSALTLLLLFIGVGPSVDLTNLQPMLSRSLGPVWIASIPSTALLSLVVLGLWFTPYLRERRALASATGWSLTIIGSFVIVSTVYAQGIFTYRGVAEMLLPILNVVRSIRIGRVFERLDVFFVGPWILVSFLIVAFYVYLACQQVAWIGGTRHYRAFSLPITVLVSILSIVIVSSDAQLAHFINIGSFAPYVLVHTLAIPLLLLIVRAMRGLSTGAQPTAEEDAP